MRPLGTRLAATVTAAWMLLVVMAAAAGAQQTGIALEVVGRHRPASAATPQQQQQQQQRAGAVTAAAAGAQGWLNATGVSYTTVFFSALCPACAGNSSNVMLLYQPLLGPTRIGRKGGTVASGYFSVAFGSSAPLAVTGAGSLFYSAHCDGIDGSRITLAAGMVGERVIDSRNGSCTTERFLAERLPRMLQDATVNLTCGSSSEVASRSRSSTSASRTRSSMVVKPTVIAKTLSSPTFSYRTLSLKNNCSRCALIRAVVRYQPLGAPDGGAASLVTAGWFGLSRGSSAVRMLATQAPSVFVYAECVDDATSEKLVWSGDALTRLWDISEPSSPVYVGPGSSGSRTNATCSSLGLWPLVLEGTKNGDFVGRLTCASGGSTGPGGITQDVCEGIVCKPTGPCDKASACDPDTGACRVTEHLPAGAPCSTGAGRCTSDHTCDLCAGVVCTPKGPCELSSSCNATTGTCQPVYVAPGSQCLNSTLGKCTANHTCDACYGVSCGIHGNCSTATGACVCEAGWGGADCGYNYAAEPCYGKYCNFHGTCNQATGQCVCEPYWQGADCDVQVGICEGVNCNNGECVVDADNQAVCICDDGWGGPVCLTEGKFGGRNLDAIPPAAVEAVVVVSTEFQKQLYPPCCLVNCGLHGTCVGDGTCACDPGYSGTLCAVPDACLGRTCSGNGVCMIGGNGTCTCNPGFSGPDCATKDPCIGITCSNHGNCTGNGTCVCNTGWSGADCSILAPSCTVSSICSSKGVICGASGSTPGCSCIFGWSGPSCSIADPCVGQTCSGHGFCQIGAPVPGRCVCDSGWTGPTCSVRDFCAGNFCNHRGICNGGACVCDPGWQGTNCTQLEPEYRVAPQRNTTTAGAAYELLCGGSVSNVMGSYDTTAEIAGLQLVCNPPAISGPAGKGTTATTMFDLARTTGFVSTKFFAGTSVSYIQLTGWDASLQDSNTTLGTPANEFVMPCRPGELLAGVYGKAAANSINTLGVICRPGVCLDPPFIGALPLLYGSNFIRSCPRCSFVTGLKGRATSQLVRDLVIRCSDGSVLPVIGNAPGTLRSVPSPVDGFAGMYAVSIEAVHDIGLKFPNGTTAFRPAPPVSGVFSSTMACNPGDVIVGLSGYVDLLLLQVDITCAPIGWTSTGDAYSVGMSGGPGTLSGTPFDFECLPGYYAAEFEWFGNTGAIGRLLRMRCSDGKVLSVPFVEPTLFGIDMPGGLGGITTYSGDNLVYGFTAFPNGAGPSLTVGSNLGGTGGDACPTGSAVVAMGGWDGLMLFDGPNIGCRPAPVVPVVDACASQRCNDQGVCLRGTGGTLCACNPGWRGATCSVPDPCAGVTCSGNGVCTGSACTCNPGWRGNDCSEPDPACDIAQCGPNGAFCSNGACICDTGFEGLNCQLPGSCAKNCSGNGVCQAGLCRCNVGFSGKECEVADPCVASTCNGRGICQYGTGGVCRCNHGWTSSNTNGTDCAMQDPSFNDRYNCSDWSTGVPAQAKSMGAMATAAAAAPRTAASAANSSTAADGTALCFTQGRRCFLDKYDATPLITPTRSQGDTTMCTSYAALGVAEALMATTGRGRLDYSEKALFWCDAAFARQRPTPDGWYLSEAMKIVSQQYTSARGVASASCSSDTPARMYNMSALGSLNGECDRLWAQSGRCYTGGLRMVDLTPKTASDFNLVLQHVYTYGGASASFMMRAGMLRTLKGLKARFKDDFARYPVVRPEGNLTVVYNHAVVLVGWDFSAPPSRASERYWIVKDSDANYPNRWKLGIDTTNPALATGIGVYIAGLTL